MNWFKNMRFLFLTFVLLCIASNISHADPIQVDTTKIRKVKKIKKSVGEIITEIPGEVLKLPLNIFEFTAYSIGTNPPVENILSLIDLGKEASSYVPVAGYNAKAGLKFGFGLRVIKDIAPGDQIKFKWSYSTNNYQAYKIRYNIKKFFTNRLGLDVNLSYKKRPRESFYGLGNTSLQDKEANYTLEHSEIKIAFPFQTPPNVSFSLLTGYQSTNIFDGQDPNLSGDLDDIFSDPDFALVDGRLDGSRYVSIGGSLEIDNRNNKGQPSKGSHILTKFVKYIGTDISDGENFSEYNVDFRQYFNVWEKRIIAVRAYLQRYDAGKFNSKATPVYITSTLGGINALRGYSSKRFIDNDLAFISVEYRYPIYEIIDAFIFLDEGRVYENISDEKVLADWKYSAGFGLRVWSMSDVIAMIQFAKSDETNNIYFELGATW